MILFWRSICENEGFVGQTCEDGVLQVYNEEAFAFGSQRSASGHGRRVDGPLRNGREGTRGDSDDGDKDCTGRRSRVRSFQNADATLSIRKYNKI